MYNEGNVFVQFVWLGESLSYILSLKGAEAAHFDFPAPENDAEMILQLIPEWLMYNQLLSCRCWAPPTSDGWYCRYLYCHSGLLTFLWGMLAPLGPVIMAVIQMPGVGIGEDSIYHREPRAAKLSRKRDKRGRDERHTRNRDKHRMYCTDTDVQ